MYISPSHINIFPPPPFNLRAVPCTVHHGDRTFTDQNFRTLETNILEMRQPEWGYEKVGNMRADFSLSKFVKTKDLNKETKFDTSINYSFL